MKNYITKLFSITIISIALLLCSGCQASSDSSNPVNIAFILGIADGETSFNPKIPEFTELSSSPGSTYAFINAESNTSTITNGTITDLTEKKYTKRMMERISEGIHADLTQRVDTYEPTSSDIDMASAIVHATRQINAQANADMENVLVLYISGRSTQGLINMTEMPLYQLDVDASVDAIACQMNIDMSKIDKIIWYCQGDLFCNGSQPAFSQAEKGILQEFYTKLFKALGATNIIFKDNLALDEGYSFPNQPISLIDVEDITSGLQGVTVLNSETFDTADETLLEKPLVIPESQVSFLPDSSEYVDSKAAVETLYPIGTYLNENPGLEILLYGTCAGDVDTEFSILLSKERAEAVKKTLVSEIGVPAERIKVISVKIEDDPYYEFGLVGDAEAINRKCVILDFNSDLAKQLMNTSSS